MSNPNTDPFAEEEVTYVGPESDIDPTDDAAIFDDAYTLSDSTDDFDFGDDTPSDWAPPVTPPSTANRQPTVTADTPRRPARPAAVGKPKSGTFTVDSNTLGETPRPVSPAKDSIAEKQDVEDAPLNGPTPRRHQAPEIEETTKLSFLDRVRGLFRPQPTEPVDQERRSLERGLSGTINVSVVNRKGGVGKTLTTVLAGMTLAAHRNDRVIAIDASPEGGELSDRVPREQFGTVRSLLDQIESVNRYSHIRTHTSQDPSGLEVLGSDPEAIDEPELTGDEYRALINTLRSHYNIIITDCAQGLSNDVMEAVLDNTDVLVVVSEGADGMRSGTWVVNQLSDEGGRYKGKYEHLVDDMIVVVTQRSARTNVNIGAVADHFRSFVNHVIELPYDQKLEGGRPFTLEEVQPSTRQAGVDLAVAITTSPAFQSGGR